MLGEAAIDKLNSSHVAVFGIGGVGGHVVEVLARSGVGRLTLVDADVVEPSNINRQLVATRSTTGRAKVDIMKERILDINPECQVDAIREFFLPDTSESFDFASYDYVVDAIDTVTGKIELVLKANEAGVPVISSMGAGNKLSATDFRVADIYDTKVCPLAKVMRRELKARGVKSLKCVYSEEPAADSGMGRTPASVAWVPSAVGLIIGGEVVKDIAGV